MSVGRAVASALAIAVGSAVMLGLFAVPASAGGNGAASTDGEGIDYGAIDTNHTPGDTGTGTRGGSSSPSNCTYTLVSVEAGTPMYDVDGSVINTTGAGSWYDKQCGTVFYGRVFVPAGTNPAATPEDVATGVLRRMNLPLPTPQTSPAGDQVVNVPMWVWLNDWTPHTDTAAVPGTAITITATPTKATWSFGDGTTLTCNGPGTPWNKALLAEPTCGHTYHRSTTNQPNNTATITVAVTWTASYTLTGGGGGVLAPITRTTRFTTRVTEIQAVVTR